MAGLEGLDLQSLGSGKDGGGRGGESNDGDFLGLNRGGLDPDSEFNLSQRNMGTIAGFAAHGMGPNTSMGVALEGNRRAARAEAFNTKLKEIELLSRIASNPNLTALLAPSNLAGGESAGYQAGEEREKTQGTPSSYSPQANNPPKAG
jgi:hypothetical protein